MNGDLQIPVIELPNSDTDPDIAAALVNAAAKHGFVFVKGGCLGFTPQTLNSNFELVRASNIYRLHFKV